MTNEEKVNKILDSNYYVTIGEKNAAYNAALEMAAWKEQQMIEKAIEYLEPIFKNIAGYNCGGELTEDFKKYMEENL